MKKRLFFLLISLFVVGVFSGCKEKAETEQKPVAKEAQKVVAPKYQFPLTGLETAKQPSERSVAVMVSNAPEARPQTGLTKADLVFEFYAESNITRFLAIYQSEQPEKVGPVRSARDYFIEIAKGYNSFYVAHGYSPTAAKLLADNYVDNINGMAYDGVLFQRSKDRTAPHNSYISYDNILAGAKKVDAPMTAPTPAYPFYTEKEAAFISGTPITMFTVDYGSRQFSPTYRYDPVSMKYMRTVKDVQTEEKDTGTPVELDNVFIVEMHHSVHPKLPDLRVIDVKSGGKAYLMQRGQMIPADWRNVNGRITPFLNGKEMKLVEGQTWVNVIPSDPGLSELVTTSS